MKTMDTTDLHLEILLRSAPLADVLRLAAAGESKPSAPVRCDSVLPTRRPGR